jgi:hypothetical protein
LSGHSSDCALDNRLLVDAAINRSTIHASGAVPAIRRKHRRAWRDLTSGHGRTCKGQQSRVVRPRIAQQISICRAAQIVRRNWPLGAEPGE